VRGNLVHGAPSTLPRGPHTFACPANLSRPPRALGPAAATRL